MLSDFGTSNAAADINGDGTVNVLDLSILLSHYGESYSGGGGTAESQTCGWGTYSFTVLPGACWRPYSDSSPFNTGLPSSPSIVSNSGTIVSRAVTDGTNSNPGPRWNSGDGLSTSYDWTRPYYFSSTSDPTYKAHCTKPWGTCGPEGLSIHIPANAKPAGSGDGHIAIFDQSANKEYDFWQAVKDNTNHTITASWGSVIAATGNGLGGAADAGDYGLAAGQIRASELAAGEIDHALFMVVYCTNGTSVYPAVSNSTGRSCSSIGLSNTGAPAMGQHFYLKMSDSGIAALPVQQWKKTILYAMAHYGMYVGDTGGDSWGVEAESADQYITSGQADPWIATGQKVGATSYSSGGVSKYSFDMRGVVPYFSDLLVVAP